MGHEEKANAEDSPSFRDRGVGSDLLHCFDLERFERGSLLGLFTRGDFRRGSDNRVVKVPINAKNVLHEYESSFLEVRDRSSGMGSEKRCDKEHALRTRSETVGDILIVQEGCELGETGTVGL